MKRFAMAMAVMVVVGLAGAADDRRDAGGKSKSAGRYDPPAKKVVPADEPGCKTVPKNKPPASDTTKPGCWPVPKPWPNPWQPDRPLPKSVF